VVGTVPITAPTATVRRACSCLLPKSARSPVILTAKPSVYGGSRPSPFLSSATILQASDTAATHPNSTTIDSPRPNAFCTAAPPRRRNRRREAKRRKSTAETCVSHVISVHLQVRTALRALRSLAGGFANLGFANLDMATS